MSDLQTSARRWGAPVTVAVLLGIGVGWVLGRNMDGRVDIRLQTDTLVLPPESVYVDRPVPRTRLVDRIVYRAVPAETIKVSVPGAVQLVVKEFCRGTQPGDSVPPRSRLVLTDGRVDRDRLQLYGFTNTGQAYASSWRVRPPYEFTTADTTVRVDQPRIRWQLPSLTTIGACALAGAAAGLTAGAIAR